MGPTEPLKCSQISAVGVDSMLHVVADTAEMDSKQIQSILVAVYQSLRGGCDTVWKASG